MASEKKSVKLGTRKEGQRVLSLRIAAATLEAVDQDSELVFGPLDEGSAAIHHHDRHEDLSVRTEKAVAHVYHSSDDSARLVHVGDASQRFTIRSESVPEKVKDLGRKARRRLEQEKRARPEIVILDESTEPAEKRSGQTHFSEAIRNKRTKISTTTTPRSRHSVSTTNRTTTLSDNVDTWAPDVSHIEVCSTRSSVIRLHGLPMGITPEAIRKFFSGLDVVRVFVLLSNKTRIKEWGEGVSREKNLVKRHQPSFRVYVKFPSSPIADMALARSEEILSMPQQDSETVGVRISMTKVPKATANYLVNNLAIDCVHGCTIQDTLKETEECLGPVVTDFLWTMALRDLRLSTTIALQGRQEAFPWHEDVSTIDALDFTNYQKLVHHYNLMVDEYEQMEEARLAMFLQDCPKDVARLKLSASARLLEELDSVKHALYCARVQLRESKSDACFDSRLERYRRVVAYEDL